MEFRALVGDGYIIRLAVTTGNWTVDPLTTSIDLFWHLDLDTALPDRQGAADVRAAWQFINWLRERGDCALLTHSYHGHIPDALLRKKIAALPESKRRPRFMDSRTEGLLPQVVTRLKRRNRVADRLNIGSGYSESTKDRSRTVPENLMDALVSFHALQAKTVPDLVLNPEACQAMAASGKRLQECGWKLRRPVSETHKGSDTKLHAKFALLATGRGNAPCIGRLYLGSGNITPAGFEQAVTPKGNLEAGVVFELPDKMQWRRNGLNAIHKWLPIGSDRDAILPYPNLKHGEDFERIEEPEGMPEVAWFG